MEKCDDCVIGSGLECFYDYGGESFIFENFPKYIESWDVITLFSFCPICGHKNNFERIRKVLPFDIKDCLMTGKEE